MSTVPDSRFRTVVDLMIIEPSGLFDGHFGTVKFDQRF